MAKRRVSRQQPSNNGEVWVRIVASKRNYYISRSELNDACRVDDEAQLELVGRIEAITPAYRKHLGERLDVSLLSASRYTDDVPKPAGFFGSLTLRGSQRSALAYLPPAAFWALPDLINSGASLVCIGFASMSRGFAHLVSLFFGDEEDQAELAKLGQPTVSLSSTLEVLSAASPAR